MVYISSSELKLGTDIFLFAQMAVKVAETLVKKAKQQFLSSSEIKPPKDVPFKVQCTCISIVSWLYVNLSCRERWKHINAIIRIFVLIKLLIKLINNRRGWGLARKLHVQCSTGKNAVDCIMCYWNQHGTEVKLYHLPGAPRQRWAEWRIPLPALSWF